MFVPTRLELPIGTRVVVYIAHPATGQPFLFEAKVVHRTDAPAGLGLELIAVDYRCKQEFLDFVRGGILIDDEVKIEPA
jgi:hypothetical protein